MPQSVSDSPFPSLPLTLPPPSLPLSLLITDGARFNADNYDKQISAHLAAAGGHDKALKLLLAAGADVNARDGNQQRVWEFAHWIHDAAVFEVLSVYSLHAAAKIGSTEHEIALSYCFRVFAFVCRIFAVDANRDGVPDVIDPTVLVAYVLSAAANTNHGLQTSPRLQPPPQFPQ